MNMWTLNAPFGLLQHDYIPTFHDHSASVGCSHMDLQRYQPSGTFSVSVSLSDEDNLSITSTCERWSRPDLKQQTEQTDCL